MKDLSKLCSRWPGLQCPGTVQLPALQVYTHTHTHRHSFLPLEKKVSNTDQGTAILPKALAETSKVFAPTKLKF